LAVAVVIFPYQHQTSAELAAERHDLARQVSARTDLALKALRQRHTVFATEPDRYFTSRGSLL
jgi:hypothetical protein